MELEVRWKFEGMGQKAFAQVAALVDLGSFGDTESGYDSCVQIVSGKSGGVRISYSGKERSEGRRGMDEGKRCDLEICFW